MILINNILTKYYNNSNKLQQFLSFMKSPTTTTQPLASTSSPMLNLQTKRTLPRDVIKWMQGLDLSYSLKDYRKDLTNGFLIGEIISRYEPGKIPMHAFQNSHNQARRDNNWNLLHTFFGKQQVRNVKIEEEEYYKIKSANDPKAEQLYQFICRLYTVCTKRTLPQSSHSMQILMSPSKNPNLTASYLLKDDGLQKLENSNNLSNESNQSREKQSKNQTQKIGQSPKPDGRSGKLDGSRKGVAKRKSLEQKPDIFYEDDNQYVQKYVFDYLNEILQQYLREEQGVEQRIKQALQKHQLKPTQILMKSLPLQSRLLRKLFSGVKSAINQILVVMLKDVSEIWKFFNYFIRMLGYLQYESYEFMSLIELLVMYGINANINDKKKMNKVFMQSLINTLIDEVRICTEWRKKQKMMQIIYDFSGRELDNKKDVLFHLKEKIGSTNPLFFAWLAVLVREQTATKGNTKLIVDYIYYAHQNYSSANNQLRIPSLKILSTLAHNGWASVLEKFFIQDINIKRSRAVSDQEIVYLLGMVYFDILKYIFESNEYQTLIKGKNQGSTSNVKVYNPDNQKLAADIKQRVQNISMTLAHLYHNTDSQMVKQILAKQTVHYLSQNQTLMLILIYHLSYSGDIDDFCKEVKIEGELKSTRVVILPIKLEVLRENVNNVIAEIAQLQSGKKQPNIPSHIDQHIPVYQQLPLIDFCISNLDIKNINIELWQSISERLCRQIAEYLEDQTCQKEAWEILKKVYLIIFNYEMRMANLNTWVCKALEKILREKGAETEILLQIKQFFKKQFASNSLEQIKISIDEINQMLAEKGFIKFVDI